MIAEVVNLRAKSDQAHMLREGLEAARAVISQADAYLDRAFRRGVVSFLLPSHDPADQR